MKVLVTGAFGNIGTKTLESLLQQGHQVRCFDLETKANRRTARRFKGLVETVWGDVRYPNHLANAVQDEHVVIHLAFITDILWSEGHPEQAREVNVGGTRNLLEAMKSCPEPGRIIFASSVSVYGETQHLPPPRTVSNPVKPTIVYARHKVECEELIKESGLIWSILRLVLVPPLTPSRFDPVIFNWNLGARGEFVHPRDVGLAMATCVSSPDVWGKTLLIGGGKDYQIYYREFIRQIMAPIGGFPDEAFARLSPSSPMDWIDSSESQRILNYQKHSLTDYISDRRAALGPARYLIPFLAPAIRRWLLRKSPHYKANK